MYLILKPIFKNVSLKYPLLNDKSHILLMSLIKSHRSTFFYNYNHIEIEISFLFLIIDQTL